MNEKARRIKVKECVKLNFQDKLNVKLRDINETVLNKGEMVRRHLKSALIEVTTEE